MRLGNERNVDQTSPKTTTANNKTNHQSTSSRMRISGKGMRHHEELRFLGRNFPDSLLAAGRRGDFTIWGKPSRRGGNLGSWKPSGDLERMAEKFPSGDGDDIVGGEEGMKGEVRDPSPVFSEDKQQTAIYQPT